MGDAHEMESVTRRQRTLPAIVVERSQLPGEAIPERRFDVMRQGVRHGRRQQRAVPERTRLLSWRQRLPDAGDNPGQVTASVPAGIDVDLLKRHPGRNVELRLVFR